jgi:hypothetical protein
VLICAPLQMHFLKLIKHKSFSQDWTQQRHWVKRERNKEKSLFSFNKLMKYCFALYHIHSVSHKIYLKPYSSIMHRVPDFNNRDQHVVLLCYWRKNEKQRWLFNGIFTVKTFVLYTMGNSFRLRLFF